MIGLSLCAPVHIGSSCFLTPRIYCRSHSVLPYISVQQNRPTPKRFLLLISVNTHVCTVAKAITTLFTSDKSGLTTVFFGLLQCEHHSNFMIAYTSHRGGGKSPTTYIYLYYFNHLFLTSDVSKPYSYPFALNSHMCMNRIGGEC